jgi:hypothetical protein
MHDCRDWQGWMRAIAIAVLAATTVVQAVKPPRRLIVRSRTDAKSAAAHAQLLEKARRGRIDLYFAGDSITRRWGATDYPDSWRTGRGGSSAGTPPTSAGAAITTQNILWRLENGELDGVHPKVIVLLAGTNNVGSAPERGAGRRSGRGREPRHQGDPRGDAEQGAPTATIVLHRHLPPQTTTWRRCR